MTDIVKLHDRALEATATIVANVDVAQFALPTPCAEFDVRALLNHLIGGNYQFVRIARGEAGPDTPVTEDFVRDDARTPYEASAAALSEAWSNPALLEATTHLPFGDFPGAVTLGIHTVEVVAHGWDLAKASGQPSDIDAELCAVAWENAQSIEESFRVPGGPFGPAVAASEHASDTDKLMSWLGRRP